LGNRAIPYFCLMNPVNMINSNVLDLHPFTNTTEMRLPFVGGISAGFPSPADDYLAEQIDLSLELVKNPSATFVGRVRGNSMMDMGICNNDIVVIDRSLEPRDGKVAVCVVDGEFTLKRIKIDTHCVWLMPANEQFQPIKVTPDNELIIWGILVHVIKSF